jgi:1,2-diacylglycerol 3-alpha-glucosyltransferase
VLLEAMALGTPVVALAEMGTREVLRDGEGCLIAEPEESHFAQQCLRLLREPELRAALSARARTYARSWSAPVLTDRLIAFYARTLQRAEALRQPTSSDSTCGTGTLRSKATGLDPLEAEPEPKPKRSPS